MTPWTGSILDGGNGKDWLFVGDGDDLICGSDDADLLYGEDGKDTFFRLQGQGNDTGSSGRGGDWTDIIELQDGAEATASVTTAVIGPWP
ncbi:MAG: hypothetical protein ACR2Q4_16580 [Geminicoccaceae bacterium]